MTGATVTAGGGGAFCAAATAHDIATIEPQTSAADGNEIRRPGMTLSPAAGVRTAVIRCRGMPQGGPVTRAAGSRVNGRGSRRH